MLVLAALLAVWVLTMGFAVGLCMVARRGDDDLLVRARALEARRLDALLDAG